jgi:hypothetical protein
MRARGISSHTDRADIISLVDGLPHANPSFFHVEVLGRIGGIVPDSHIVTIPTGIARFDNGPCSRGANGGANRCGKVCPQMGLNTTVIGNATFGVVA